MKARSRIDYHCTNNNNNKKKNCSVNRPIINKSLTDRKKSFKLHKSSKNDRIYNVHKANIIEIRKT